MNTTQTPTALPACDKIGRVTSFGALLGYAYNILDHLRPKTPDAQAPSVESSAHDTAPESLLREKEQLPAQAANTENRCGFVDKISQHKATLEHWMEEKKPYRDKKFRLLDVMQVLPLNRSYISRLFNEGYGESFFDFLMRYRIEESLRLLEQHPELPVWKISEMCGFSSASVFGRAFLKIKGITPRQYRKKQGFGQGNMCNE